MIKSVIRIICFCLFLACILNYTNKVFKRKDNTGISAFTRFYELQENTVDVLILGSSHAFMDINTGTLWDECGMSSYVLGADTQPIWNTYYFLREALKYQTPKLVVIEVFTLPFYQDFAKDIRIIRNNYGLKWSKDKINSIMASAPKEQWDEFLLEYIQYHARYKELSRDDFFNGEVPHRTYKGFICLMNTTSFAAPNVTGVTERSDIYEKAEKYYRMTIELAQSENIPIMIVISPYAEITADNQKVYNTASDIAGEYGVPFVNYNLLLDEIGCDFSTDVADAHHFNYKGNQKYTKVLAKYIKENFDIPDHRGDIAYQTWQKNADEISVEIENQMLREVTDRIEIVEKLSKSNYVIVVSADGNCKFDEEELYDICNIMGISGDSGYEGIYYKDNDKGITFHICGNGERRYVRLNPHDLCMKRELNADGTMFVNSIVIDWVEYKKVSNGVNIVVYDKITRTVVDSFGINKDESYNIVR